MEEKPGVLHNTCFCLTGRLSDSRKNIEKKIKSHSGLVSEAVTDAVDYVISTEDELTKRTQKIVDAEAKKIPILSEEFLNSVISEGHFPRSYTKYILLAKEPLPTRSSKRKSLTKSGSGSNINPPHTSSKSSAAAEEADDDDEGSSSSSSSSSSSDDDDDGDDDDDQPPKKNC
eukprot:TRINITY_DN6585_c0_g1_i1.p1 TRINITY_DN6585_c0_g1~~TRINITY_DN6585_c0_g1_i1.p1  ORF type:complete len:173 (-),score=66.54 TRINITY_DN6585_c0_g1_i1:295-813(-)